MEDYKTNSNEKLATDEGSEGRAWQNEDVGLPIHGVKKSEHSSAKKVYDLFPSEDVGGHFTRSGSPGGSKPDAE